MKAKKGTLFLIVLVAFVNILIIAFPSIALQGAHTGLFLWFNNVLPGVLPFVVGANVLMSLGIVSVLGFILNPLMGFLFKLPGAAGFPFAMGMISGYPVGAKIVCQLRQDDQLSKKDAQRLLSFTNNGGPLFIVGAVGVSIFSSSHFGYFVLIIHYGSAIALGLFLSLFARGRGKVASPPPVVVLQQNQPFGKTLGDAVKKSMETMLLIGGFMVLFSVVSALFLELGLLGMLPDSLYSEGIAKGLLEAAGGIASIGSHGISRAAAAIVASIISFGGLSVMFQSLSFISKTDLSSGLYVLAKVAHGLLAFVGAFALYPIFSSGIEQSQSITTFAPGPVQTLANSTLHFFILIISLAVISLIFFAFRFLRKKSS